MARQSLRSAALVAFGVRCLFLGGFWTPPEHRGKLARWPEDKSIPEADIRLILDDWGRQQAVAWALGRTISWSAVLYSIVNVWP